jgi:hypothetical protein
MTQEINPSIAGKIELITSLLDINEYDEDGNVIGHREPIITKEQALELLQIK